MRTVSRVVSALLALALLVLGVIVAIEIIVAAADKKPWLLPHDRWYRYGLRNQWRSGSVRWMFIGIGAAGLLLLFLAFTKRRPVNLPLQQKFASHEVDVHRSSLERSLSRAAQRVDGISGAKVKVSPNRTRVVADSSRRNVEGLDQRVAQVVTERLQGMRLTQDPEVSVTVRPRETR